MNVTGYDRRVWEGNFQWEGGRGCEDGEFTYVGDRGSTVINYILEDGETKERIEKIMIGDKVDSDHYPVEVMIKKGEREGDEGVKIRGIRGGMGQ